MIYFSKKDIFFASLLGFFYAIPAISKIEHKTSYPFIAGDTFRAYADFILDQDTSFDPAQIPLAAIIFVQIDHLGIFFKDYHSKITNPYILLTHRCAGEHDDDPIPDKYIKWVDDPKMIAWFSQNIDRIGHPKLKHLPIGLANQIHLHGDITVVSKCIKKYNIPSLERKKLLYLNFMLSHPERSHVANLFKKAKFCTIKSDHVAHIYNAGEKPQDYLKDLAEHCYVLSPRGHGLDCHRTWEALLMGCIPIVRSSTLDPLYENLPVLIINQWEEVTEEFLYQKYSEIINKTYNLEKLYAPYWLNQIAECKKNFLNSVNAK